MKFVKALTFLGVLSAGTVAFAGGTQIGSGSFSIKCHSEAPAEMGATFDSEVFESNGKLQGRMNGVIYNKDIKVEEYEIGPKALAVTAGSHEYDEQLNDGERRIAAMKYYLTDAETKEIFKDSLKINFDLALVKKVKLYDLDGTSKTNKFGGAVLIEAFDQDGALLGRLFSSMMPGDCR